MKKNLLLVFGLAVAFAACQKDETPTVSSSSNNETANKNAPPALHFTQKVLVEEFAGCNYGNVPNSNYVLNNLASSNNKVIVASMHINDVMTINQNMTTLNSFKNNPNPTIPCAMMNRELNGSTRLNSCNNYNQCVQQSLSKSAGCGIAISTVWRPTQISVEVSTQFACAIKGQYTLTTYLVHETLASTSAQYSQANNFNGSPNNPFFNRGNPINGYVHHDVVFQTLQNGNQGKINQSAQVAGGIDRQAYTCDIPSSQLTNDIYVIAFVTDNATRTVMNVQKVKLGMNQSWD